MLIWLPFLVALVGLVCYVLATNAHPPRAAADLRGFGLLVGLLQVGHTAVSILH